MNATIVKTRNPKKTLKEFYDYMFMNPLVAAQVRAGSGPGSSGNGLCPVCEDEARPRDTRLAPCGHVFCGACDAEYPVQVRVRLTYMSPARISSPRKPERAK